MRGVLFALLCAALLITPLICGMAADEEPPEYRALLIGIDDFVSRRSTYPSSTNNVYAMQEAFQRSSMAFESLYIPESPVTSREELVLLIRRVLGGAKSGDVSFLYISTHGVYDPDASEEPRLLLSDGETEGAISASQLESAFDGIEGTIVLLLDACNSGAFIGKGMVRMPEEVHFIGDRFKVLTSSGAMEESWYWSADAGGTAPQGAFYFTQALAQSLSGRGGYPADINRDGSVTLRELHEYLLQNHAASTPQVYPQQDDFVVFTYDAAKSSGLSRGMAAIRDISFSSSMLDGHVSSLTLEYVATRPVRVAYQLVFLEDGRWRFQDAQLLYDNAERYTFFGDEPGRVSAGRKVRTLSLNAADAGISGYIMVQIVTIEEGRLTVHAGRVICVPPAEGQLELSVVTPGFYQAKSARELPIFVMHAYPCALSVAVVDEGGEIVRRICHRQATRPMQIEPQGSTFYWDGLGKHGEPVPPGKYRVRASGVMNELTFTVMGDEIVIE